MIGFLLGWFAAAPFAWPYVADGFDGGNPATGVLKFLVIVFLGGAAMGLAGLALGSGVGAAWQRSHEIRRSRRPVAVDSGESDIVRIAPVKVRLPHLSLRYADEEPIRLDDYLLLTSNTSVGATEAQRAIAALQQSVNVSAWDGSRLVGVARVVTDGLFFAALADLTVHGEYRNHGVARELINRAYDKTPRGVLHMTASADSAQFFAHLGCERGGGGYLMRRRLSPLP